MVIEGRSVQKMVHLHISVIVNVTDMYDNSHYSSQSCIVISVLLIFSKNMGVEFVLKDTMVPWSFPLPKAPSPGPSVLLFCFLIRSSHICFNIQFSFSSYVSNIFISFEPWSSNVRWDTIFITINIFINFRKWYDWYFTTGVITCYDMLLGSNEFKKWHFCPNVDPCTVGSIASSEIVHT